MATEVTIKKNTKKNMLTKFSRISKNIDNIVSDMVSEELKDLGAVPGFIKMLDEMQAWSRSGFDTVKSNIISE